MRNSPCATDRRVRSLIVSSLSAFLFCSILTGNVLAQSAPTAPAPKERKAKKGLDPAQSSRKANIGIAEQPPIPPPAKIPTPRPADVPSR